MADCVFCNIVQKQLPAKIYYEDDQLMIIQDILPKAPIHMVVITKEHIATINHAESKHESLLGHAVLMAKKMAEEHGVADKGYRLVFNVGAEGGQIIPHLHMHLLGGKQLSD